jgi:hypothetical protein
VIAYLGKKKPDFPKKGSNLRPTSAYAKVTWASEVPLTT